MFTFRLDYVYLFVAFLGENLRELLELRISLKNFGYNEDNPQRFELTP